MSVDPALQHMSEVAAGCNSFSVDSLMTARDGSPDGRLAGLQDNRLSGLQDMSGYNHYSPCLYPTTSSLEELSNMTAACIPQSLMSPPYSRPNWYSMPGGHSPSAPEQQYAQPREYFESLGKPPSPGACSQVPYRTPPYRAYYPQDCEKY